MYSIDGKRFVNRVLAGKERALGSHISLGMNIVYDAVIDGDGVPSTHNRYHSAYIVDDIPIINSSVVSGLTNDEIVFAGNAGAASRYVANNEALVVIRNGGSTSGARTLANVINTTWTSDVDKLTRPSDAVMFTDDGVLQLEATYTATMSQQISLYNNRVSDILAFPLILCAVDGTPIADPSGVTITMVLTYTDGGVEKTCTYTNSIVSSTGYMFNGDSVHNKMADTGTLANPNVFVFQRRISDTSALGNGATAQNMVDNGKNIIKVEVTADGGSYMRFGSIKVTPDFDADDGRVTIAFRKLASNLYKTVNESYVNAEYRVSGVVS